MIHVYVIIMLLDWPVNDQVLNTIIIEYRYGNGRLVCVYNFTAAFLMFAGDDLFRYFKVDNDY